MNNKIPNRLKEIRTRAGMSQFDVALKLGFKSTDRISRWETGLSYPHIINLFKMARIYGVRADELYPEIQNPYSLE